MNDEDGDMPRGRPETEDPGNGLTKRVSFAGDLEEESGVRTEVNAAGHHGLPRNTSDLRERIARLEGMRNSLGVHQQEWIGDVDDMIAYLRDQLESDATRASAMNTMNSHDERVPEPRRSESIRRPTIIYEYRVPRHSRRDDVTRVHDRFDRRPIPRPPRPSNAENITVASHYPRDTYDDFEITEVDASPGETNHEGRHSGHYESMERQRSHGKEEDSIVEVMRYPDHDRPSQRGWRERSARPSRQDSTGTRGGPIIVQSRNRSRERSKSPQSRASRQPSPYVEYIERRMREREEGWDPERPQVMIRRNERSKSRPREKQDLSGSGSEYSYNGYEQPIVGEPGQSQALVLRAGATGIPYDYVRERVLDGGIRVRGDDVIGSPRPESVISQRFSRPSRRSTSRRGSHRDRSWAPSLRRRLSETWHQFESIEDDEYRYPGTKRVDSEKEGSEAELSDAEVIAQTLKKFTTIQDSDMPKTGIAAPPIQKKRGSETEVGPSALKNTSLVLPGPERKNSLPILGRKAHFEQDNEVTQPSEERQSSVTNGGSKLVDEGPFLDRISEEPDVIIEGDDVPHHQRVVYFPERPVLLHPQQRPSFPFPTDLDHHSRESSPRPQARNPSIDSPRIRPATGPDITEHGGYISASQSEILDPAAQEEGYDEVENIRQISRNPTVHEEAD